MTETCNQALELELKRLIIDTLELEDITPADIDPSAPPVWRRTRA